MAIASDPSEYEGQIDRFDRTVLAGWIRHATGPSQPVAIRLVSSDGDELSVIADQFREDLLRANKGNGRHGFQVNLRSWFDRGLSVSVFVGSAHVLGPIAPSSFAEIVGAGDVGDYRSGVHPELAAALERVAKSSTGGQIVFDVSDLMAYFTHARLPTGIQRVQIEAIPALIMADRSPCRVVAYVEGSEQWTEIPRTVFVRLCQMAVSPADDEEAWRALVERVRALLREEGAFQFASGSYLINLGTSWWLKNYFLSVRAAKDAFGIKYVPFIHDCIPLITPEHCSEGLVNDFINWINGVFRHADLYLCNSEHTARDFGRVAQLLGFGPISPTIVRLDADYRRAKNNDQGFSSSLKKFGLENGEFILFVATIEPRKNHLVVFSALLNLLKKHGPRAVPTLVCVGRRGWLNDAIYERLRASRLLSEHVLMLSDVSDDVLGELYEGCRFTVYPSLYEGWGLPVTESLCYGKVPVASKASSLPEAGGKYAIYVNPRSETEVEGAIESLILDPSLIAQREKLIADDFRPRSWTDIGFDIVRAVESDLSLPRTSDASGPFTEARTLTLGRFYSFAEKYMELVRAGDPDGEVLRSGVGWERLEPWGVWSRPGGGELHARLDAAAAGELLCFLKLAGLPDLTCNVTITVAGRIQGRWRLSAHEERWIRFIVDLDAVEPSDSGERWLSIGVVGDQVHQFSPSPGNPDARSVGVGLSSLYVCAADNLQHRVEFFEGMHFGKRASVESDKLAEEIIRIGTT